MKLLNHEYYVSLEVAELLREAGFKWKCKSLYDSQDNYNGITLTPSFTNWNVPNKSDYSAPTLDVAQRWLREVHHLHITIFSSSQESWMFRITKQHQNLEDGVYGEDFCTYEEAQEAGIKKAFELILEK